MTGIQRLRALADEMARSGWRGLGEELHGIADQIEPDPRAEEITAKAYRAAADYIDWNIPDSEERVRRLRERAEELEAMAREVESGRNQDACPANVPQASSYDSDTTKCDRETLLALADESERKATKLLKLNDLDRSRQRRSARTDHASDLIDACARIRAACGEGCR